MRGRSKKIIIIMALCMMILGNMPVSGVIGAETGINAEQENLKELYEKAEVKKVDTISQESGESGFFQEQLVTVKVLSGKYKGQVFEARNTLSGSPGWDIEVNPGDRVLLYISEENEEVSEVYISDMARASYVNYLVIAFILVLILIGGLKGIKSLLALGLTVLAIYKILLPAILKGSSPLVVTILVLAVVTFLTMFIIGGLTRKSMAATLGTIGGVMIAGLLAILVGDLAYLSGFATEESRMLLFIDGFEVDMQGLLFAGIIIGALGATMDVAMSIASAIDEVRKANPNLNTWQLIGAGMNVGRDIMGTMTNTLILAYAGGALPLLLLYMAYNTPGMRIFNSELIATEIVRAIVGSIGLVCCVPITASISGVLSKKSK